MTADQTFGEDMEFLSQHVDTIVLKGTGSASQVIVVPAYQGRVMTSTSGGLNGSSYGWINYAHIESGTTAPHINVFGGEERFWLGPEGGQFSIFFPPGSPFEFSRWQTPSLIDTEPYEIARQSEQAVAFHKDAVLKNYSDFTFEFEIDREIAILTAEAGSDSLGVGLEEIDFVGYRTTNKITNTGDQTWSRDTGLLSIWLLGMYKPSPKTTVVIPFQAGAESELGPIVNDEYFGKIPAERLRAGSDVLYFSGDGRLRSKIGITPQRSAGVCGSYDSQRRVLTIVKYNQPGPEVTDYVNSMWELQEQPYAGDAINSYNDGPPEPGAKPLGPFYELETSSPALALKPGESGIHMQETYHVVGPREQLDRISKEILGVSLDMIETALK